MRYVALVAVLLAFAGLPAVAIDETVPGAIVKIYTTYQEADWTQPWHMLSQEQRTGSGSVITGRRILTNAHVVSDQTFLQVRRAGEADKFVARVVAVSHELDLALLTVDDPAFFEGVTPLKVGDLPRVGETVVALGFPVGGTRLTITEGVVSRIDRQVYSHSYLANLVCQIDAAINPGSSGGPVLNAGGEIVGVAFETGSGDDIGYMVPAPLIRHFFHDLDDGSHDGVPGLFVVWESLENPHLRSSHGIETGQTGVLLVQVAPRQTGDELLLPGDVLLAVDGFDVANDGSIAIRPGERIPLAHAIDRRHIGDVVALDVQRNGDKRRVDFPLTIAKRDYGYLIPRMRWEVKPSYMIIGGLVFSPLTSNYLALCCDWESVPVALRQYYYEYRTKENEHRDEIVVLIDVLADEINMSYGPYENWVVQEVNGRTISGLRDVIDAFEENDAAFHRIVLEDYDVELVLPRRNLAERSAAILRKYSIPADRSADLPRRR